MRERLPPPAVMCDCGGDYYTADQVRQILEAERELYENALHDAISRALDEASVTVDVLRGMCLEVGFDAFERAMKSGRAQRAEAAPSSTQQGEGK